MRLPFAIRRLATGIGGSIGVRIRSGPNAGCRWTLTSAGRGIWRGRFEPDRVALLEAVIRAGDVVWDLGAHKGYVTLLAARRVGDGGRVLACEPASANRTALLRHVEWNALDNVHVEPCAVSQHDGTSRIGGSGSTVAFRLGAGPEEVSVRSLPSLLRDHPQPDVIKVDVEGEEAKVLRGAGAVLRNAGVVVVSVHSPERFEECLPLLRDAGFETHLARGIHAWRGDGVWRGDPDILAVRPGREPTAAALQRFAGER